MSILQHALESRIDDVESDSSEKLIVMKGPLSEILYRALNIVYAKGGKEASLKDYALESIAQDIVIAKTLIENIQDDDSDRDPDYIVFGVSKDDIEPETLVEVKSIINEKPENTKFILMITDKPESTDQVAVPIQSNMDGKISSMTAALEALVETEDQDESEDEGKAKSKGNHIIKGPSVMEVVGTLVSSITSTF